MKREWTIKKKKNKQTEEEMKKKLKRKKHRTLVLFFSQQCRNPLLSLGHSWAGHAHDEENQPPSVSLLKNSLLAVISWNPDTSSLPRKKTTWPQQWFFLLHQQHPATRTVRLLKLQQQYRNNRASSLLHQLPILHRPQGAPPANDLLCTAPWESNNKSSHSLLSRSLHQPSTVQSSFLLRAIDTQPVEREREDKETGKSQRGTKERENKKKKKTEKQEKRKQRGGNQKQKDKSQFLENPTNERQHQPSPKTAATALQQVNQDPF